MKKILIVGVAAAMGAALVGCFGGAGRGSMPPMPPPGYALIDARTVGYPKDYVKFHNEGTYMALGAQVQFLDPKTHAWRPFGGVTLKGPGDTDTMKHSTDLGGGLKNLRYFAVSFTDGRPHAMRLDGAHHDLHVYVGD